jgi:hypothetical protein
MQENQRSAAKVQVRKDLRETFGDASSLSTLRSAATEDGLALS